MGTNVASGIYKNLSRLKQWSLIFMEEGRIAESLRSELIHDGNGGERFYGGHDQTVNAR
ncbi:MAG: hypothetical protein AB7F94_10800 [Nitrospira sp.]